MIIICMMIAFLSCIIGSVCGIGGGIIIKPLMDAMGMYNVVTINFMSCCTVLGMSAWNVGKTLINKEASIDFRKTTYLAFGAAVGGMSGKRLFAYISSFFAESDMVGGIQAGILLVATFATFLYTLEKEEDTFFLCAEKPYIGKILKVSSFNDIEAQAIEDLWNIVGMNSLSEDDKTILELLEKLRQTPEDIRQKKN